MHTEKMTILHVEDDRVLAGLVQAAFDGFGFQGEIIPAESVHRAKALLDERERTGEPLDLIISDMNLPDGTGLDIIHAVRTSAAWRMTPLIILSGEANERTVRSAYALGANCFMPKISAAQSPVESLRSLYTCWLENALLPRTGFPDRRHAALERAIELRTRASEFYLNLAAGCRPENDETDFLLNRSLSEGNLANLAAFFRNKIDRIQVSSDVLDRVEATQGRLRATLQRLEELLDRTPCPPPAMVYRWMLDLADTLDERVFAETLGSLFPVSPVATAALKARAALQLREVALHVMDRTQESDLRRKASVLLDLSQRLIEEEAVSGRAAN